MESLQKGGKNGKNKTSSGIIRSLEETRESYMVQLLTDSLPSSLQPDNFDELKVNPILKKLAPEKQAIALEELVHLVKADQLSLNLDETQKEEEQEEGEKEESIANIHNQQRSTSEEGEK